jgi:hypothetical protein
MWAWRKISGEDGRSFACAQSAPRASIALVLSLGGCSAAPAWLVSLFSLLYSISVGCT